MVDVEPLPAVSALLGRRSVPPGRIETTTVELERSVASRLAELVDNSSLRLLTVLATAAGIVTARYAERDDLLVCVPGTAALNAPLVPLWIEACDGEYAAGLLERATAITAQALLTASMLTERTAQELYSAHLSSFGVCVIPRQHVPQRTELVCAATACSAEIDIKLHFDSARISKVLARQVSWHIAMVLEQLARLDVLVSEIDVPDIKGRRALEFRQDSTPRRFDRSKYLLGE